MLFKIRKLGIVQLVLILAFSSVGSGIIPASADRQTSMSAMLSSSEIIRASAGMNGEAANGESVFASTSVNGRVAFESIAMNLVQGDTNDASDLSAYIPDSASLGPLYVKQDATGLNTGTSWENAFTDLQSALAAASSGDEIWVAAGVYKPGGDRTSTFSLKNGVAIYGGFAGTETERTQRNPSVNMTVLSGDLNGDDNDNVASDEPTRAENAIHVVSSGGNTSTSVLDGFMITGGNANLDLHTHASRGGGMWNGNGSPTLANLRFVKNSSLELGGGMYTENNSQPALTNIVFQENVSEGGGGLANYASSPILTQVTFIDNYATFSGGGALNSSGSNATFDAVTFSGNSAFSFSGGMGNYSSNPIIKNSTFYDNHALGQDHPFHPDPTPPFGGAMYNANSNPVIENSTFSGNTAGNSTYPTAGSAIGNSGSSPQLYFVTIANNHDGIMNDNSYPFIGNSIIWGNAYPATGAITSIVDLTGSTANVSDSIIQNGYPGTNVINEDPKLGTLGGYGGSTLTIPISSIGSANDRANPVYCPPTDQRGVPRPQNVACDMGAYEYDWPIGPFNIVRASVNKDGVQADFDSRYASISGDGHYVAYASYATNLVTGDTNNAADIFVRNMADGTIKRASMGLNGLQSNGSSYMTSLSGNGHYIAFESAATNLVANDFNGVNDIFIHHLFTGLTTRVSVHSDGTEANDRSSNPVFSDNGRYVAFESSATNLMSNDQNGTYDIFIHDTWTGTTSCASLNTNGEQGNSSSLAPSVSADGRYVAFNSYATNLVTADANTSSDIFVRDMQTGTTTLVSVSSSGIQGNGDSVYPAISGDGRYIAFSSSAANLVSGDTNGRDDIFLYDAQLETTTRISVDSNGVQGNSDSLRPSISGNGRYVTFHSSASNLVINDTNANEDVFVYDTQTGVIKRISVNWNQGQGHGQSLSPFISNNAQYIAFYSYATNFVVADTNGQADVFVYWQKDIPLPPTSTVIPGPTITATAIPSSTSTPTATYTPVAPPTTTYTPTPTDTATPTPTYTLTSTPTATTTPTPTLIPTNTPRSHRTPNPTKPPRRSVALLPIYVTTQSGTMDGSLTSLNLIEQNGVEDNASAYLQFQTPGQAYVGYQSFHLPNDATVTNISSMLVQVNFKRSDAAQVWTWSVYDWVTGNWVQVGDSLGTPPDKWNNELFLITNVMRFVSTTGEIRVRLYSSNALEDLKVDYEAIHVTYDAVEPQPTNSVPTTMPTKPKYNYPPTLTPTP